MNTHAGLFYVESYFFLYQLLKLIFRESFSFEKIHNSYKKNVNHYKKIF